MTRVLIGDDHPVVRSGLKQVLDTQPDFVVVAEASEGAEAVRQAVAGDVDVAILDVAMPKMTGLQAAEELRRRCPHVRVLMLSMYDDEQYLLAAIRAGAAGYVLKSVADTEIVEACRMALRGARFIFPSEMEPIARRYLDSREEDLPREDALTTRETQVLKLVAEGHSSQQIAELLVISIKTVDRHRSQIMRKLGVHDRVQLARHAIRRGLIEP